MSNLEYSLRAGSMLQIPDDTISITLESSQCHIRVKQIKIIFPVENSNNFLFFILRLLALGPKRVTVTVYISLMGTKRHQRHSSHLLGLSVL